MSTKEIMRLAEEWSLGDPEQCIQMFVAMDRLVTEEREACARIDIKPYITGSMTREQVVDTYCMAIQARSVS